MSHTRSPMRAEAGVVIGGCELVRRIGRGGMAEVWVARRALGGRGSKFVAIKLLADHYVGNERYTRMFRAEAELAAVLSHANIVQVFDEGEDDGRSFLVMEWVDGLNLLKLSAVLVLLGDEPRRFRVIAYIIGQLLHALHYAHSITSADGHPLGVVHRDVSPHNVLVSNHGEVKLADFGVAYHAFEESSGVHVKGKVRYMAPEQLAGKTRSPTVDLYAVGALLHELLDGRRFRGEHEDGQELFSAVLTGMVSPLLRPVPPELDRLRLGLLVPDPARRIQTAAQAFAILKRYPGYGDARDELTTLCGSLTGVLRPRAGLGQSAREADAPRDAIPWSGGRGSVRPKLLVEASAPVARPPAPSRARPAALAPGSAERGVPWRPPFADTTPCQDTEAAERQTLLYGSQGAPAQERPRLPEPWTRPEPVRPAPTWSPRAASHGPAAIAWPESASATTHPALGLDGETEPNAPEETNGAGESSSSRSKHAMLARISRGPRSWRSAVPLGFGMGLVTMLSVGTAWWLVRGAPTTEAAWPSASELERTDATVESIPRRVEPLAPPPPPASPRAEQPAQPSEPSVTPPHPTDHAGEAPQEPPVRKAKVVPKVLVKVRGGMGLDRAQVRIGKQTVTVGDLREVMVPVGRRTLAWREHPLVAWKPGGAWKFEPGTTVMAFVTKDGLELRALP